MLRRILPSSLPLRFQVNTAARFAAASLACWFAGLSAPAEYWRKSVLDVSGEFRDGGPAPREVARDGMFSSARLPL